MKSVRIHEYGGPEVLMYEELDKPSLNEDGVLVKLEAIGVNFTDIYTRTGLYPARLPLVIGVEGAGLVAATGRRVKTVGVGDPVVFYSTEGAYSEYAAVPESRLVKLPTGMDCKIAAAVLVQGMTAHYLVHDVFNLGRGQRALIHAGAGGVGRLLIQMAKLAGASVIATASSDEKAEVAKEAGADETIVYTRTDFESEVRRLTGQQGVNVVYDSVGKATLERSIKCLRPRGYPVLYGQSSGVVSAISVSLLQQGSFFLTRPMLRDYVATHDELTERANGVFNLVESKRLEVKFKTMPLVLASEAHRLLESRQTVGKLLLIP